MKETPEEKRARHGAYWKANVRVISVLMAIWAFVSLGCSILFVELLNKVSLGGVPFGFWMAQQGSIYVFVILICVYVYMMKRIDEKFHVMEEDAPTEGSKE